MSNERPREFNFELFLFDSLHLPRGLFSDDKDGPVDFPSLADCRHYCERFVQQELEAQQGSADERATLAEEMRDRLQKEAMFRRSGVSLAARMITGNATFDANLNNLRLDCFGNVMMLNAPAWSDLSAQFTHGFPRRLVVEPHGGILPGNLTVAAKITNQAIRSLSTGDVAGFISRAMVQGLGLTKAELMLARASAIKYAGKREKPARLIDHMVRFGIDFLRLTPLTADQIKNLRESSSVHWSRVLSSSPPDSSDSESSSSEGSRGEVSVSWDTREECAMLPAQSTVEFSRALEVTLNNFFSYYMSSTDSATPQPPAVQGSTRARSSGPSGQRRRRVRPNAETAGATVTGSGTTESSTGTQRGGGPGVPERVQHNAREVLLDLPGIVGTRIPSEVSLARLEEYLKKNQPIDPLVS